MTKVFWGIKQCSLKFGLKGNVEVKITWFNLGFWVKSTIFKELHYQNWVLKVIRSEKSSNLSTYEYEYNLKFQESEIYK